MSSPKSLMPVPLVFIPAWSTCVVHSFLSVVLISSSFWSYEWIRHTHFSWFILTILDEAVSAMNGSIFAAVINQQSSSTRPLPSLLGFGVADSLPMVLSLSVRIFHTSLLPLSSLWHSGALDLHFSWMRLSYPWFSCQTNPSPLALSCELLKVGVIMVSIVLTLKTLVTRWIQWESRGTAI